MDSYFAKRPFWSHNANMTTFAILGDPVTILVTDFTNPNQTWASNSSNYSKITLKSAFNWAWILRWILGSDSTWVIFGLLHVKLAFTIHASLIGRKHPYVKHITSLNNYDNFILKISWCSVQWSPSLNNNSCIILTEV